MNRNTLILSLYSILLCIAFICPPSAAIAQENDFIMIHARGNTGEESMRLIVNDEVIKTYKNISNNQECMTKYKVYIYDEVTIKSIKVESASGLGWPHSILVDKIEINGEVFETESEFTLSYGSRNNGNDCESGFTNSEFLDCPNSWFEYQGANGIVLADEDNDNSNDQTLTSTEEIYEETVHEIDINIYPNPVAERLNIHLSEVHSEQIEFILFNSNGQLIETNQLNNLKNEIFISELESGMYLYQVRNKNEVLKTGQLIKV